MTGYEVVYVAGVSGVLLALRSVLWCCQLPALSRTAVRIEVNPSHTLQAAASAQDGGHTELETNEEAQNGSTEQGRTMKHRTHGVGLYCAVYEAAGCIQ